MNRREALTATAALLGTTLVGAQAFLSGCSPSEKPLTGFSEDLIAMLDEVGETILPETPSSPGAKAARIGQFMKVMVTDCYSDEERATFFDGVKQINSKSRERFGKTFIELAKSEKEQLLSSFDKESRAPKKEGDQAEHFFNMLNQLTVWGFFSSEPGATKALRYVPVPGRYEGCIDYKPGEAAWVY
jgi:hypothetical protein